MHRGKSAVHKRDSPFYVTYFEDDVTRFNDI